jgi:hypothetical protein
MRKAGISYNGLPDNETNGYQTIEALKSTSNKWDSIKPLTLSGGIIQLDFKISLLENGEYLLVKPNFDKTTETQIKGLEPSLFTLSFAGSFKSGEHCILEKTAGGFLLTRLADHVSLNSMVDSLGYLKKASEAEETAGEIDNKATTPLINKIVYGIRTIGTQSGNYLATALRNGLYPKEHFTIVANIAAPALRNRGGFSGVEISGMPNGTNLPVFGNIVSATVVQNGGSASTIRCVVQNTMTDTNYKVSIDLESQSDMNQDNRNYGWVFKPINATTFDVSAREPSNSVQNIKVHLDVIKL